MAYTGKRPILPGRKARQTDPVTGAVTEPTYSYHDISNLDGQPLADMPSGGNHVPGTGYYPGDTAMTRRFDGSDTMSPLDAPGLGPDTSYMGHMKWPDPVPSANATLGGHLPRETEYSLHTNMEPYQGVPASDHTLTGGHAVRYEWDTGVPTGGGATSPMINKGVGVAAKPIDNPGRTPHPGEENIYGHFQGMEPHGVPSAKAL